MSEYISIFSAPCYCLLRICFVGYGLSPFFLLIQLATLKLSMLNLKKNAWLSTFKI